MKRSRGTCALIVVLALMLAACSWPQPRSDAAGTGFQPFEAAIGTGTVGALGPLWSASLPDDDGVIVGAVTGGVAYVGGGSGKLAAYDASGRSSCSGTPRRCAPLWTARTSDGGFPRTAEAPAVVDGVVYSGSTREGLLAFDGAGTTHCTGNPRVCTPLWTGFTGFAATSAPAVADGRVFVTANTLLYAFDAHGCGTASCQQIWSADLGHEASGLAVANGHVYVSTYEGRLSVFDASGGTGCTVGLPRVCTPVWSGATGTAAGGISVADGTVFVASSDGLAAFDATGTKGCSGAPLVCTPLWRTRVGITAGPAVANHVVYGQAAGHQLYAFDATGTNSCSGSPKTCAPLWSATLDTFDTFGGPPSIANGVVYSTGFSVRAFDAHGVIQCSPTDKTCAPLWERSGSSPVIVNGILYTGSLPLGHDITAYALPPPT